MRSFRLHTLAFAFMSSAALAGSASAAFISQSYSSLRGYSDIAYTATLGPLPVIVLGNPFADPDNRGVIAALQKRAARHPGLRFTAAEPGTHGGYRLILAFGGFAAGANYCDGRNDWPLAKAAPGSAELAVTYCVGGMLRSQVLVSGRSARNPSDANFDAMVDALSEELFR